MEVFHYIGRINVATWRDEHLIAALGQCKESAQELWLSSRLSTLLRAAATLHKAWENLHCAR